MKFPGNITGPIFAEGDLVNFNFEDAELTFRAPKVPYNRETIDKISPIKDFRNISTSDWKHFGNEGHCTHELLVQNWNYEDSISHDDVAHVLLKIMVLRHSPSEVDRSVCLNSKLFREYFLACLKEDHEDSPPAGRSYWPSVENSFFAKTIKGQVLDGLQAQVDLGGGEKYPVPSAYFSLGRRYSLRIALHFGSLHYFDYRKNPYSEELLHQFKLDAFNDFLSHIRIEYTPETIALIERLRT